MNVQKKSSTIQHLRSLVARKVIFLQFSWVRTRFSPFKPREVLINVCVCVYLSVLKLQTTLVGQQRQNTAWVLFKKMPFVLKVFFFLNRQATVKTAHLKSNLQSS